MSIKHTNTDVHQRSSWKSLSKPATVNQIANAKFVCFSDTCRVAIFSLLIQRRPSSSWIMSMKSTVAREVRFRNPFESKTRLSHAAVSSFVVNILRRLGPADILHTAAPQVAPWGDFFKRRSRWFSLRFSSNSVWRLLLANSLFSFLYNIGNQTSTTKAAESRHKPTKPAWRTTAHGRTATNTMLQYMPLIGI